MTKKVLFIEGFNEIPPQVREYLEKGWEVFNAPRPLYGHDEWVGDCRHGVFYAAVAPDGDPADEFGDAPEFRKRNRELEGWPCEIVPKSAIDAYEREMAEEYGADVLATVSRKDLIVSYSQTRERE